MGGKTIKRLPRRSVGVQAESVIGLAGPFGSGCTTAARELAMRLDYTPIRLSGPIRERWHNDQPEEESTRANLQELGNRIRREANNPGEVARLATLQAPDAARKMVIDGIRNVGEIEYLRQRFGRSFFLLSIDCPASDRLERLRQVYGMDAESEARFSADNERDKDQEV